MNVVNGFVNRTHVVGGPCSSWWFSHSYHQRCRSNDNDAHSQGNIKKYFFQDGETYDPTQMDQEAKTLMSRLFSNRSNCFYLLDRFEDSLSDAQESFAIDPLFAKAWLRAAQACVKLVNFDKLQGEKLAEGAVDAADKTALATPSTLPANALSSCSMEAEIEKIKTHADLAAQYLREGLRVEPANGTLKNVLANLEGKEAQFKLAKGFGIADLISHRKRPTGHICNAKINTQENLSWARP